MPDDTELCNNGEGDVLFLTSFRTNHVTCCVSAAGGGGGESVQPAYTTLSRQTHTGSAILPAHVVFRNGSEVPKIKPVAVLLGDGSR